MAWHDKEFKGLMNKARRKIGKHIGFDALEQKVYKEYRKKGYSIDRAKKAAFGTAGKVAAIIKKRHG